LSALLEKPSGLLVRQVLGAIAQFEKASVVAKLKAARDRRIAAGKKCGGRKSYAEARPDTVALVKQLHAGGLSYRKIAVELASHGHLTAAASSTSRRAAQKMFTPNSKA
jgi:DNA invertase Pin-like site-specific DNA recombinase